MNRSEEQNQQLRVSFSGVDGAGKSTQIAALCAHMRECGLRVELVTFWDDIARLKRFRESAGHTFLKGDKGVGSPSAPIHRKDKNVQSWPMTLFRLFLYSFDAASVRAKVRKIAHSGADVVVFDRYLYDELANLPLSNPFIRTFIRLLMQFTPRPDVSYILDADPEQARARKPEYPIEFVHKNRKAYMDLSAIVGGMTVISPSSIEDMRRQVRSHADAALAHKHPVAFRKSATDLGTAMENVPTGTAAS